MEPWRLDGHQGFMAIKASCWYLRWRHGAQAVHPYNKAPHVATAAAESGHNSVAEGMHQLSKLLRA
jgi:hypothetical protein